MINDIGGMLSGFIVIWCLVDILNDDSPISSEGFGCRVFIMILSTLSYICLLDGNISQSLLLSTIEILLLVKLSIYLSAVVKNKIDSIECSIISIIIIIYSLIISLGV